MPPALSAAAPDREAWQRSRLALLNFLAASIDPAELPHTTVVFDAHDAPPGLPRVVQHGPLLVRFAPRNQTADELIAELIRGDSAPRRLLVVSSDHEVQRSAHRRRAKAIDSETWYAELIRVRRRREEESADAAERPAVPLLQEDVGYWLSQFGGESELAALLLASDEPNRRRYAAGAFRSGREGRVSHRQPLSPRLRRRPPARAVGRCATHRRVAPAGFQKPLAVSQQSC